MKVGIFTFHRALNYGAFLQAIALQNYIKSLGHDVDIVDYWPKEHASAYSLFSFHFLNKKNFVSKFKSLLFILLRYTRLKKRKAKMEMLLLNYLNIRPEKIRFTSPEDLESLQYDLLIYGSDQIWWKWNNLPNGKRDWTYWGDYVPKNIRKVSYAASMGVIQASEEEKKIISCKLSNFHSISVRENKLKDFLQLLTTQPVIQTLDPVFLISKYEWERVAKEPQVKADKYVLLFNLMKSKETEIVAKRMSVELKCKLIEVTPSIQPLKFAKNVYQTLDAFEFIGLIKNAEFVVTSSFHCVAFSIVFEKQFYAVGMKNNSIRVTSLLAMLGIANRYLPEKNDELNTRISYCEVSPKLNAEIVKSKNFLNQAIKDNV